MMILYYLNIFLIILLLLLLLFFPLYFRFFSDIFMNIFLDLNYIFFFQIVLILFFLFDIIYIKYLYIPYNIIFKKIIVNFLKNNIYNKFISIFSAILTSYDLYEKKVLILLLFVYIPKIVFSSLIFYDILFNNKFVFLYSYFFLLFIPIWANIMLFNIIHNFQFDLLNFKHIFQNTFNLTIDLHFSNVLIPDTIFMLNIIEKVTEENVNQYSDEVQAYYAYFTKTKAALSTVEKLQYVMIRHIKYFNMFILLLFIFLTFIKHLIN